MKLTFGVFLRGLMIVATPLAILTMGQNTQAVDSTWIDHPSIKFTLVKEFTNLAERPVTTYGTNTTCTQRSVVTKPATPRVLLPDTPAVYADTCMNDTNYGSVGTNGLFIKPGVNVAGPLALKSSKESLAIGPNLKTGIIFDATAPTGVYVNFALNISSQIDAAVQLDKTVKYTLKSSADVISVKNAKNERLMAITDTVAFSSNGDWMLFDSPFYGLVRLNTNDGTILSFGGPSNYNNGSNPGYSTAISADGRYAIISGSNLLTIYDLQSCVSQSGSLSYLMNCKSRSLHDQRVRDANFGTRAGYIRFTQDNSFTYYVGQLQGSVINWRLYRVTMGDVPQFGFQYLGLGDSFASGEGAFNYKTISQSKCHISPSSYPYLIGSSLNKEKYESVACSGAVNADIFLSDTKGYRGQAKDGLSQDQRDAKDVINQFLPGKITQNTYLENLRPEAITISVGGNDLDFGDKITNCVFNKELDQTCFDTLEDRKEIAEEIYRLTETLIPTYQKLKENNRRVYVVGYPKIVKPGGDCANNVKMNASELAFADKLTVLINDAVEFAAGQAGVGYVDVENILEGRRLCETNSDNTLVNGITQDSFGIGTDKVIAAESFHPKNDAHMLYKNAILAQTNNLTKPMPVPATASFMPRLQSTDPFFRDLGTSGRTIYNPIYKDLVVPPRLSYGDPIPITLDGKETGFAPLSQIKTEIHSNPTNLGNLTTDINGSLTGTLTIPNTVDAGYHSIHLYGVNQAGQNVDVYDYVLIGASGTDFDGDGVLDKNEGCVFNAPSGQDSDQDGIDNACDGVVDPLPPPPPPVVVVPIVEPVPEPIPEPELQPADDQILTPDPEVIEAPIEPEAEPEPEIQPTVDPATVEGEIIVEPAPQPEVIVLPAAEENQLPTEETSDQSEPVVDPVEIIIEPQPTPEDIIVAPITDEVIIEIPENPPIDEIPPEDEIIDLPVIQPIEPPKDVDGNGETVAGNEQMAPPETIPVQNNTETTPIQQPAQSRNNFTPQPERQIVPSEDNLVLGSAETKPSQGVNNAPVGKVLATDTLANNAKFYKKRAFYYTIIGSLLTLILLIFALMRRKKEYS